MKNFLLKLEVFLTVGWFMVTHPKFAAGYLLLLFEGDKITIEIAEQDDEE